MGGALTNEESRGDEESLKMKHKEDETQSRQVVSTTVGGCAGNISLEALGISTNTSLGESCSG